MKYILSIILLVGVYHVTADNVDDLLAKVLEDSKRVIETSDVENHRVHSNDDNTKGANDIRGVNDAQGGLVSWRRYQQGKNDENTDGIVLTQRKRMLLNQLKDLLQDTIKDNEASQNDEEGMSKDGLPGQALPWKRQFAMPWKKQLAMPWKKENGVQRRPTSKAALPWKISEQKQGRNPAMPWKRTVAMETDQPAIPWSGVQTKDSEMERKREKENFDAYKKELYDRVVKDVNDVFEMRDWEEKHNIADSELSEVENLAMQG